MRQDYLVSLIVPVYNEEATIELFIKTIKAKLFPEQEHLEVVFVDDGSKDRSAEIIHELMAQEEKLRRQQQKAQARMQEPEESQEYQDIYSDSHMEPRHMAPQEDNGPLGGLKKLGDLFRGRKNR